MYIATYNWEIAAKHGLDISVIYDKIYRLILSSRSKSLNYIDGKWWTRCPISVFKREFPWWSESKLKNLIRLLVAKKLIIKGVYNRSGGDRTSWYALTDESNFPNNHPETCVEKEYRKETDYQYELEENDKSHSSSGTSSKAHIKQQRHGCAFERHSCANVPAGAAPPARAVFINRGDAFNVNAQAAEASRRRAEDDTSSTKVESDTYSDIPDAACQIPKGKKKKPKRLYELDSEEYLLAKLLLSTIMEINPQYRVDITSSDRKTQKMLNDWADFFRKLLTNRKKPQEEIIDVIDYVKDTEFWWGNIESASGFYRKYDTLQHQMYSNKKKSTRVRRLGEYDPEEERKKGVIVVNTDEE